MNSLRRIGARFLLNRHSKLQFPSNLCHRFSDSSREEDAISRDWLNQLWLEERKKMNVQRGRKQRNVLSDRIHDNGFATSHFNEQPTTCRHVGEFLSPTSPEEVKLAPLLARSNLLITRDIEWANIMLAIEQESRYAIIDPCFPQSPVGFIHEKSNLILRQLLRSRRPFTAQIIDAMGNEIFRIRRPIWFINSTIYAEVDGKEIGVVHRRWHLWKRIYDLYLGNNQFAVVMNPGFWNWTFSLKDENDNVLAQIDRDWRGVGFELFTDAGQYVIRFGDTGSGPKSGLASVIEQLEVARPLTLAERAVAVALAVSLDSDYFSRRGGWGLPFLIATE